MMRRLISGKYKSIVVSIALFVILDLGVLSLNFYTSVLMDESSTAINIAGRQRMLSQKMTKELLRIERQGAAVIHIDEFKNFKKDFDLFNDTFYALYVGGKTTDTRGLRIPIEKVTSAKAIKALADSEAVWKKISTYARPITRNESGDVSKVSLRDLLDIMQKNNLFLLKNMNALTNELEMITSNQISNLRLIQSIAIVLAIINFTIILFHFIGNLRQNDKMLEKAHQETKDILNTVNEGLFLLDNDYRIGSEYSKSLEDIFGSRSLASLKLDEVLRKICTEKTLDDVLSYVEILFNEDVYETLVEDLNPLDKMELNIPNESGGFDNKYIRCDFTRVYRDNQLAHLLVTVKDITEQISLQEKLESSTKRSQKQLDTLSSVLHVDPKNLRDFVDNSKRSFQLINEILKRSSRTHEQQLEKVRAIFSLAHRVKGDASAVDLEFMANKIHDFENTIESIQKKNVISGNDFLPLAIKLDELLNDADIIYDLSDRLKLIAESHVENRLDESPQSEIWQRLTIVSENLSKELGKQVCLVDHGFLKASIPSSYHSSINDLLIQCVQNAICHGIEEPALRSHKRKTTFGCIFIDYQCVNQHYVLSIRDDGQGLNIDRIREKAIDSKIWSSQTISGWNNQQLINAIFHPGFSTSEDVSSACGRGVGMDLVNQISKLLKCKVSVSSRTGFYTEFKFTFPIVEDKQQVA